MRRAWLFGVTALLLQLAQSTWPVAALAPYPILFVTQVPVRADFNTIGSTFGNHKGDVQSAVRGGDLWIRYPDGTLKNLTQAAGYGMAGLQLGDNAIAVRDPAVSWDGTKALFSMVRGAPAQYQTPTYYWQLYEISGLGQSDTPVIVRVPHQPSNYNNVMPVYSTDGSIIFVSDRPRDGQPHTYPQRDEYELSPTNTGLWRLDPNSGDLRLLNHAPSGDFWPMVDSFGRVLFTQWDHLQRDQQADADSDSPSTPLNTCGSGNYYGTFNYSAESANATPQYNERGEVFPEARTCRGDLLAGTNLVGHTFNQFFPWQIRPDGTGSEILNHLGRHELHAYIPSAFTGDANLIDYYQQLNRFNPNPISNMFMLAEDPTHAGRYYGIDAPEFGTHASGQVFYLDAPPDVDADHISVTYVTHRDTANGTDSPNQSGRYRDPLVLADGSVLVSHSTYFDEEVKSGDSAYNFQLKPLSSTGAYWQAGASLTGGLSKSLSWYSPDALETYNGLLWELNAVEVRARPVPPSITPPLALPEQMAFTTANVAPANLQTWLKAQNLALLVVRNVTTRDDFDFQQPFNLKVSGGVQSVNPSSPSPVYSVNFLQIFQADLLRGWRGCCSSTPQPGRRVLAQPLHDTSAQAANPSLPVGAAVGSFTVFPDGSAAAFVPAGRALTWQLTAADNTAVVRERYWLTFQAGEMRSCDSCHGPSSLLQTGAPPPTNQPQALSALLDYWRSSQLPATPSATPLATSTPAAPLQRVYLPMLWR